MADMAVENYRNTLNELTCNNKLHIKILTLLAEDYAEYSSEIADAVEKFLNECPRTLKMTVLYVVDAIIKNVPRYRREFQRPIVRMFVHVFQEIASDEKVSLLKLRNTWVDIFPQVKLYEIDFLIKELDNTFQRLTTSAGTIAPAVHSNLADPTSSKRIREDDQQQEQPTNRPIIVHPIREANRGIFPVAEVFRRFEETRILDARSLVVTLSKYLSSRGHYPNVPAVHNEATLDAALLAAATIVGFEAVPQHPINKVPLTWKRLLSIYKTNKCELSDEVRIAVEQLKKDKELLLPRNMPDKEREEVMAVWSTKLSRISLDGSQTDSSGRNDVWCVTPDGEDGISFENKEGHDDDHTTLYTHNGHVQNEQCRGIVKFPKVRMKYPKLRRITFLTIHAYSSMAVLDYMMSVYEKEEVEENGVKTDKWEWKGEIESGWNIDGHSRTLER